ncbi:MAG: LysR family transcriptional regulator [Thomasclavelia sp.]|nr:LysR family transcriptional regulator [Thomasclavelia sp.]
MELRTLEYFLIVAREGNITRAAKMIHISQPTLSRQLIQLEDELQTKLFVRSNHSISLTDDGLLLKRRASEIISLVRKTKNELSNNSDLIGEISIGTGEFNSVDTFSKILNNFKEKYPLVTYNIISSNTDDICESIENGLLDFGIILDTIDISKYESLTIPYEEVWGIYVYKDSKLASLKEIKPQDLINYKLYTGGNNVIFQNWKSWFGKYFQDISVIGHFNLTYNTTRFIYNTNDVILGIKLDVKYKDICFIPIKNSFKIQPIIVWKEEKINSIKNKTFINYLKEEF